MALNELARQLNGVVNGRWINVRGPHHSAADRSLGIRFDPKAPNGFRLHSFADDDEDECRAHVMSLIQKLEGEFCDLYGPIRREAARARKQRAMALWQEAVSATGTPVGSYLKSRALKGIPDNDVLRFHAACPFGTLRMPAMLGLITDAVTGEPIGVHRTALKEDGSGKRNLGEGISSKQILGLARRGVIRLRPSAERIGISEGVETALSAAQVFDTAVWTVLSNQGIASFPILRGIKHLTVFADNDSPGLTAASKCCRYYQSNGINAAMRHPPGAGADWNDFVKENG